ncbi:hypothetical protein [Trichocoleus sp. FACHB-262]|uniref:hypothetical protein n=1 Tax=Trichocoleus sp. FACHB-262 TaxID=2692869 RepID=UPI002411575F|nr:hypothetical protein [Trichocoleus sp. FACHB-262]
MMDELFVRVWREVKPTARAVAIASQQGLAGAFKQKVTVLNEELSSYKGKEVQDGTENLS